MSQVLDVAVIGATGTVGETLLQVLEERDFPLANLHLLAGSASAGQSMPFKGRNLRVRDVADFDFSQVGLAFLAVEAAVAGACVDKALAAGCRVVDLSASQSLQRAPRIVPEVNGASIDALQTPLVGSPASVVCALAVVLKPLQERLALRKVTLTAALAVSNFGREGVAELARQTTELLNMRPLEPRVFGQQVAFNLLGQSGSIDSAGFMPMERRISDELKQVLGIDGLQVSVTCLVAPVFFGDSLSVSLQCSHAVDLEQIVGVLEGQAGIELVESQDCPTVVGDAVGQDDIYVGRLRAGIDDPAELNLWIASDNVRKGAALNAVQIAELLIKHHL